MNNQNDEIRRSLSINDKNEPCLPTDTHEHDHNQMNMNQLINDQSIASSIPMKSTTHRSCLKHRPDASYLEKYGYPSNPSTIHDEKAQSSTDGHTSGRVSFAYASINDDRLVEQLPNKTEFNSIMIDKNHRSAVFAKKAKEFVLAEATYFKDHAHDNQKIDD